MTMDTLAIKQYQNNHYLHALSTMDTCGQTDIIQQYNQEAKHYQRQNTFNMCPTASDFLAYIHKQIIGLLQEILTGSLPLDVAFCRLIVLYGHVDCDTSYDQYVAFLFYFILGSCLPSIRSNIKIHDPSHASYLTLYCQSELVRYLMDTYFAKLNDKTCIKFKYHGQRSTGAISSILQRHITTATEHGDVSIVPIICDYVQYPNEEFLYFINNF
eukprot:602663_1